MPIGGNVNAPSKGLVIPTDTSTAAPAVFSKSVVHDVKSKGVAAVGCVKADLHAAIL